MSRKNLGFDSLGVIATISDPVLTFFAFEPGVIVATNFRGRFNIYPRSVLGHLTHYSRAD